MTPTIPIALAKCIEWWKNYRSFRMKTSDRQHDHVMSTIAHLERLATMQPIDIVFDGPPSHESGRFVEVEDASGKSMNIGQWIKRADGFWALRIDTALRRIE